MVLKRLLEIQPSPLHSTQEEGGRGGRQKVKLLRCQAPLRRLPRIPNYPLATFSIKELEKEDGRVKRGPDVVQSKGAPEGPQCQVE